MMMFTLVRQTHGFSRFLSRFLLIAILAGPAAAQQPAPPKSPPAQTAAVTPAFDELLATDSYKMYGEVRNVGTLLSNGGAGEIVDPIVKLSDPGPQFKSIISFLKKNSEALAQSRLMFATWPVRTNLPMVFVAIEFPTNEHATRFAPRLETFLPTILPPVPDPQATLDSDPALRNAAPKSTPAARPSPSTSPKEVPKTVRENRAPGSRMVEQSAATQQPAERLPFVITHAGNLVCITEKDFKFSQLRPKDSRPLFYDQNFRMARDQFSSEPIFFFFNVALEDKAKPAPAPTPFIAADDTRRIKVPEAVEDETPKQVVSATRDPAADPSPDPNADANKIEDKQAVLMSNVTVTASPMPTPTKEQQAQRIAGNQIGTLLDSIGYGEPQWPEAVGVAVALEGNEYIVRAIMIDKPGAKKTPLPFVPQLVGGPAFTSEAASVLPDDTDVLISASIDLVQTFDGMRREADKRQKADASPRSQTYENGVQVSQGRPKNDAPDVFASFEKNSGMKIKEELLPAFGHEIAIAGSMKTLNAMGLGVMGLPRMPSPSSEADKDPKAVKKEPAMPALLIEVKDRDAARPLMPKILTGLGIGEANLLAQTEKHGDAEIVNYAGIFAYAFVGDFVVISDALGVQKIVDAYNNHTTLSSNTVFRNSRRWQSSRTSGQVYVSPVLMEGYQDQIRKSSASMDAGLRDFLLGLNPNAEAITYAMSDDGMGLRHELRLPKNYILMSIASISSAMTNPPPEMNEGIATGSLQWLASAETQYKDGLGKGSYGSMQQLVEAKLFQPDGLDKYGYKYEVTVSGGAAFEATATPKEYGKGGKRSFFIDQTGVVRGDDHAGAPATVSDKPVQQ